MMVEERHEVEMPGEEKVVEWIEALVEQGAEGPEILSALHEKEARLEMVSMQSAVEVYLGRVKAETLEVMSSKYGEFAKVAESVSGSAAAQSTTTLALMETHNALSAVSAEAKKKRLELEAELERKRASRKREREHKAVEGFGLLLDELEKGLSGQKKDVERLAHASLSLKAQLTGAVELVSEGASVTRIREYARRVEAAEAATRLAVEASFERTCCRVPLKREDDAAREACFRAAACLGAGPRLEQVFATKVLGPFLEATFTQGRLDGAEKGSRSGLKWIFAATLEFVRDRAGLAVQACERAMSTGGDLAELSVDLLCNGVWAPVVRALLETDVKAVFKLGIAEAAHSAYAATFQFMEDLAQICVDDGATGSSSSLASLKRLEASKATEKVRAKFELQLYFELVKLRVKTQVAAGIAEGDDPYGGAVVEALRHVWDPSTCFVLPIAPEILGLSCDLIRDALLKSQAEIQSKDTDVDGLAVAAIRVSNLKTHARHIAQELAPKALTSTKLRALDVPPNLDSAFSAILQPAPKTIADGLAKLAVALADRVADGLRLVKSVTARYHLTNAPFPSAPSDYLAKHAFLPLDTFDLKWRHLILPLLDDDSARFYDTVAVRVHASFATSIAAVLDHATKFQATLAKRRQRKHLDSSLDLASDARKIAAQLLLDLDAASLRLDLFRGCSSGIDPNLLRLRTPLTDLRPTLLELSSTVPPSSSSVSDLPVGGAAPPSPAAAAAAAAENNDDDHASSSAPGGAAPPPATAAA